MMSEGDSDVEEETKGKGPAESRVAAPPAKADSPAAAAATVTSNPLDSPAPERVERIASIPDEHLVQDEKWKSTVVVEAPPLREDATTEELLAEAVSDSLLDDSDGDGAKLTPAARALRLQAFAKESAEEIAGLEQLVSVTNPVLQEGSLRPYITYDVTTKHGTVSRRYREFAWLHHMLEQMCPGMIIPHLPEKQALGRFDQQFIERRRADLERFLRRVASHPDLSRSGPYLEFCTTTTQLADGDIAPAGSIEAVGRILSTLNNAASALITYETGPWARPKGDLWFDDKASQVESLEACLARLVKALDAIRDGHKELGQAGLQLATSMRSEALNEHEEGLRSALNVLADTEDRLWSLQADEESHFTEPLAAVAREYQGMAQALMRLFQKRLKVAEDLHDSKGELVRSQAAVEKQYDGPDGRERHAIAERDLEKAKTRSEELRQRFSELSATIRKECARFDRDRQRDLAAASLEFAKAAVAYQQRVVRVWEQGVHAQPPRPTPQGRSSPTVQSASSSSR